MPTNNSKETSWLFERHWKRNLFWSTFDSKNSFWQEVNKIKFEAIKAIQYIGESWGAKTSTADIQPHHESKMRSHLEEIVQTLDRFLKSKLQ